MRSQQLGIRTYILVVHLENVYISLRVVPLANSVACDLEESHDRKTATILSERMLNWSPAPREAYSEISSQLPYYIALSELQA